MPQAISCTTVSLASRFSAQVRTMPNIIENVHIMRGKGTQKLAQTQEKCWIDRNYHQHTEEIEEDG